MALSMPVRFIIAIVYDIVDFLSIPVLGTAYDLIGVPLGVYLWGPVGLMNAWELVEPTDQIDKFIPTMVIAGLVAEFGLKTTSD